MLNLQGAGSLSCARRGWINIDTDIIECESCGAQLTFTISASWSPTEGIIRHYLHLHHYLLISATYLHFISLFNYAIFIFIKLETLAN